MEREQLKSTLRDLHDKLSAEESIDDETTALLQQLADDIDRLSQKPEAAEPLSAQVAPEESLGVGHRAAEGARTFCLAHDPHPNPPP